MPEIKIALADGGELQFNQSFLQFIGIKKYMQRVTLEEHFSI